MEKNLTTGNIFKTIVYFALPYLLSYFLQTLYGMADLFIIGQFDHVDAITAVSNGSQVMHMLTVIIVGLAMGATVTISRAVGADRKLDAARAIGNTVTLFMAVSILYAPASSPRQAHCCTDRFPDRSGDRYHTISYHLFYRNSLYYSL